MEIPQNLKDLYRHWYLHTGQGGESLARSELLKEIEWFVNERISIWKKKTQGETPPFTTDPILSTYKFCNIFREFDRQTIEFHTLLNPLRNNFPLWLLNMFCCRMVARPETIKLTGLLSFDAKENRLVYERLIGSPRPRYGTPYIFPISVIQRSATPTRELFITQYLPQVMRSVASEITTWNKLSVYEGVDRVLKVFKYELRFLWTEVLIDVAYQYPGYIDLFKRFPIGPGAAPTLSRISPAEDPSLLVTNLAKLKLDTGLTFDNNPLRLSAENWEGIACEFRKYTNLKSGRGRKRLYKKGRVSGPLPLPYDSAKSII